MGIKKLSIGLSFLFLTVAFPGQAEEGKWDDVVMEIEGQLTLVEEMYREGKVNEAKGSLSRAYFDLYEGKGMESATSLYISSERKVEVESMFGGIRGAITGGASPSIVKERIDNLLSNLREDATRLGRAGARGMEKKGSPYTLLFNSFVIILREGFEAILIITALATYLVKMGQGDKVKVLYRGAIFAIVASILTALLFQVFFAKAKVAQEALEGITMLLATAVLFYVSYWLITKIEVRRWQHYIRSKVERSLKMGSLWVLTFASFLAVYREGAETVLFYQALYSTSRGSGGLILAGFIGGSLVLTLLFILIRYGSLRIPIGPFFAITSTLLYYLAFSFAGKGILELQVAGWVSSTPVEGWPTIGVLGFYPTWEGITLQAVLIGALLVAVVYSFLWKPYMERARVTIDISHIESDIKTIHDVLDDVGQHAMICHGLTSGVSGQEVEEIRRHLVDIDKKVHEVAGHLTKLEKGLEDIFSEIEREIKIGVRGQGKDKDLD